MIYIATFSSLTAPVNNANSQKRKNTQVYIQSKTRIKGALNIALSEEMILHFYKFLKVVKLVYSALLPCLQWYDTHINFIMTYLRC